MKKLQKSHYRSYTGKQIVKTALVMALLSGVTIPTSVFSDTKDWNEFRGPTGQGLSTAKNLPESWGPDKNIDWRAAIPGSGWSSPVLAKGKVFLTAAIPQADSYDLSLVQVEAENGIIERIIPLFHPPKGIIETRHKKNSFASPTPIYESGKIYAHFGHMGIACVDVHSGNIDWKNDSFQYKPVHGNGGSPVLYQDRLIFSCDGGSDPFLLALSKHTGEILWKVERDTDARKTFSFCTPLVIEVDGKTQVISPGSNRVGAYNPTNGELIWQVRYDGYSVAPRPVYAHGLVFISTGFDRPELLAIRPTGSGDVTDTHIAWSTRRGVPLTPSLLVVGEEIYLLSDGGILSCLDAKTGEKHWDERIGGDCSASPIYADGKIYLQNEAGEGFVALPGKQFKLLATNDLQERTLASYAVQDGSLFIRSDAALYRISPPAEEKK